MNRIYLLLFALLLLLLLLLISLLFLATPDTFLFNLVNFFFVVGEEITLERSSAGLLGALGFLFLLVVGFSFALACLVWLGADLRFTPVLIPVVFVFFTLAFDTGVLTFSTFVEFGVVCIICLFISFVKIGRMKLNINIYTI